MFAPYAGGARRQSREGGNFNQLKKHTARRAVPLPPEWR